MFHETDDCELLTVHRKVHADLSKNGIQTFAPVKASRSGDSFVDEAGGTHKAASCELCSGEVTAKQKLFKLNRVEYDPRDEDRIYLLLDWYENGKSTLFWHTHLGCSNITQNWFALTSQGVIKDRSSEAAPMVFRKGYWRDTSDGGIEIWGERPTPCQLCCKSR